MKHSTIRLILLYSFFLLICYTYVEAKNIEATTEREYWINTLTRIADPVLNNLSKDSLKEKIPIIRSNAAKANNREFITHMEAVGRTIAGLAPWLELGSDSTKEGKLREKYIKMTVLHRYFIWIWHLSKDIAYVRTWATWHSDSRRRRIYSSISVLRDMFLS